LQITDQTGGHRCSAILIVTKVHGAGKK